MGRLFSDSRDVSWIILAACGLDGSGVSLGFRLEACRVP